MGVLTDLLFITLKTSPIEQMDLNVSNHKKNVFVARLIPVIWRHSQFCNDLHLEFASHLRSGRRTTRIQILEGSNMWYQSFLNLSDYNCILTDYHIVGHDGSKWCCGIHIMLMCVLFAPYVVIPHNYFRRRFHVNTQLFVLIFVTSQQCSLSWNSR